MTKAILFDEEVDFSDYDQMTVSATRERTRAADMDEVTLTFSGPASIRVSLSAEEAVKLGRALVAAADALEV